MRFSPDRPLGVSPATVSDYRELARRRMPRQMFDYIDGGAYEESTMRSNVSGCTGGLSVSMPFSIWWPAIGQSLL